MQPQKYWDDGLLRPETKDRDVDDRGGAVFIALVFAGLAVFAVSTNGLHQIADIGVKCPVAAIAYCDRQ